MLVSGFAFIVGLEVLLHVVRAVELPLTAKVRTSKSLFGSMNFRVARSVAGGCERLVTTMRLSEAARISLWSFLQTGCVSIGDPFIRFKVRRIAADPIMTHMVLLMT